MRSVFIILVAFSLWFTLGLPAAGWHNAHLRMQFCDNYRDPMWANNNHITIALFGPIGTAIGVLSADYAFGWTLSRQPTTENDCRRRFAR